MKSLVVGGDAKLSVHLAGALISRNLHDRVVLTTRHQPLPEESDQAQWVGLDLLDPYLPPNVFDVLYLVAAITKLAPCEADPATAWRVNADAPVALALQAKRRSSSLHIVFVSSEAVELAPNLVYSRAKAYAEAVLLSLGATVVRPKQMTQPGHYAALAAELVKWGESQPWGVKRWAP